MCEIDGFPSKSCYESDLEFEFGGNLYTGMFKYEYSDSELFEKCWKFIEKDEEIFNFE